jgi:hypothetical protein
MIWNLAGGWCRRGREQTRRRPVAVTAGVSRGRAGAWTALRGALPIVLPGILVATLLVVPVLALTGSGVSTPDTLDSRSPAITFLHPAGGEEFSGASAETLRFQVSEDCWKPSSPAIRLRVVTDEQELLSVDEPPAGPSATYEHPWALPDQTVTARVIVTAVDRYGWATAETSGAFRILHSLTQAELPGVPNHSGLSACYPNPFNPVTTVPFTLQRPAGIELAVFDLRGRRLATLVEGVRPAGWHTATWDGRDQTGQLVASGTYLARLRVRYPAREVTFVQRVTLVK